jgi:hypothetical protein
MGHYLRRGFTDPRRGIGDVFYSEMSFTGMKHLARPLLCGATIVFIAFQVYFLSSR